MEKKILLLAVVLSVTCLCSSEVMGLDMLGPPASTLVKGETSIGLAYFTGQMDLDVEMTSSSSVLARGQFDGVKQQRAFVDISHGITDNIDIFGRIGGSRLEIHEYAWFDGSDHIFDGDMGLAIGGGLRGTIYEHNSTKFGAVGLLNWSRTEDQRQAVFGQPYTSATIDYYELMLALGVVHQLSQNVNIYGGPFLYWLKGDLDGKGTDSPMKLSGDIEEDGNFGGYVGGEFKVTDNWSLLAEFQLANAASGFGISGVWRF
ncbi:MAG: hypothetical protein A2167_03005 [Planctomycetes bacterium RBG_13_46_10]|nr:MAG: hypothetical protein A2167_03005 [Planctomycetes bacterium RBG_13_46_10]